MCACACDARDEHEICFISFPVLSFLLCERSCAILSFMRGNEKERLVANKKDRSGQEMKKMRDRDCDRNADAALLRLQSDVAG